MSSWIVLLLLSVVHGRVVIVCLSVLVSPFLTPSYTQPIQLQAHTPDLAKYTESHLDFLFLDSEINIDGLPDYCMGESADIEEIEVFNDSAESMTHRCLLICTPYQYLSVI